MQQLTLFANNPLCRLCDAKMYPYEHKGKAIGLTRNRLLCEPCAKKRRRYRRKIKEKKRVRNNKRKAVALMGGRCQDCGLVSEWDCAYDFHHRDKSEKSMHPMKALSLGWDNCLAELSKCDLLCAVCHRIRHQLEHNERRHREHEEYKQSRLRSSTVQPRVRIY